MVKATAGNNQHFRKEINIMKKALKICFITLISVTMVSAYSFAGAKREKFGIDKRHQEVARLKVKPSTETFKWKMVMPWSKGLLFYDIAVHFCDTVRLGVGRTFEH